MNSQERKDPPPGRSMKVGEVGRRLAVGGAAVAVAEDGIDVAFVERGERLRLMPGAANDRPFVAGRIVRGGRGVVGLGVERPEAMVWGRGQH